MSKGSKKPYETPEAKVAALLRIEALIEGGMGTRKAVETVAAETGMGARSLYTFRKLTDFVPRDRWAAALARKGESERQERQAPCAPEAMAMLADLCQRGVSVRDAYSLVVAEAAKSGWSPIPSERTLRRRIEKEGHLAAGYKARRDASTDARESPP